MLRPSPYSSLSAKPFFFGSGLIGGLFGGLFSAAGAPIAYLMYRQPLAISVIRSSLLAVFFLSTFVRAVTGGFAGHYTPDVLIKTLIAAPVMLVTTMLIEPTLPAIPDQVVRGWCSFASWHWVFICSWRHKETFPPYPKSPSAGRRDRLALAPRSSTCRLDQD